MILPDKDLYVLMEWGCFPEDCVIGPSSVDLRLGRSFAEFSEVQKRKGIQLDKKVSFRNWEADTYWLEPGQFLLATTLESIKVPSHLAAYVEGRSSIGRLGLQVQNAGYIDAGFEGEITLELKNQADIPIKLVAGVRVCQLVYVEMTTTSKNPYSGKYQHQKGATGSRIFMDEEFS